MSKVGPVRGKAGSGGKPRIKRRRPKLHFNYTVLEAAALCQVTVGTIRRWISKGLPALTDRAPTLIRGPALAAFLEDKKRSAKQTCLPGTLYCLRCRSPQLPALDLVEFEASVGQIGNLKALCATCGAVMNRRCRPDRISTVMPDVEVSFTPTGRRLIGCKDNSANDDSCGG